MASKQAGFTLVEIAIVLVIIGLVLSGVLKGQELITNAKIRNLRNDFNGIAAAVYAYQDRYHQLPGDDPRATAADRGWADAQGGNGDGRLASASNLFSAPTTENGAFWQHLRYAGLLSGNPASSSGGRDNPTHAFGGWLGAGQATGSNAMGLNGLVICAGDLDGKAAFSLDSELDDGVANTGKVRARAGSNNAEPSVNAGAANYLENGTSFYTVCQAL